MTFLYSVRFRFNHELIKKTRLVVGGLLQFSIACSQWTTIFKSLTLKFKPMWRTRKADMHHSTANVTFFNQTKNSRWPPVLLLGRNVYSIAKSHKSFLTVRRKLYQAKACTSIISKEVDICPRLAPWWMLHFTILTVNFMVKLFLAMHLL